jgi:hypothetical protein
MDGSFVCTAAQYNEASTTLLAAVEHVGQKIIDNAADVERFIRKVRQHERNPQRWLMKQASHLAHASWMLMPVEQVTELDELLDEERRKWKQQYEVEVRSDRSSLQCSAEVSE